MEYKDISPSTVTEELLREMIMELKDGDQLPSQRELAEKLQVSRNAVKYALARLQKEGDIRVKNRQGIRVNKKIDVNLLGMRPLSSELGESNEQIQQLSAKIINTPNSLESFFESSTKQTLELKRLRLYKNQPFSFEIAYLDAQRFEKLVDFDFNNYSLYKALKENYGVQPTYGYETITCVLADESLSRTLQVEEGKPLYQVDSFNYEENDVPVEHTVQYLIGSNFKYHFKAKNIFDYQEDL